MTTKRTERRQYRVDCPHCRAPAQVRTSVAITNGVRELYLICQDPDCGHVFAATAEIRITITHTIAPSLKPNPAVELRVVVPRMRHVPRPVPANDTLPASLQPPCGPEVPRPANDDDVLGEAVG
jgi:hypothetical protein